MKHFVACSLVACGLLMGCDDKAAPTAGGGAGTPATAPNAGTTAPDMSTPASAAKAFLAAAGAKDTGAIKGMVHPDAMDTELKGLRAGTLADKDWEDLKTMGASAKVGEITTEGDTARVRVSATMKDGKGDSFTLRLKKHEGRWLVFNW